jgi:hypothetical protein
MTNRRFKSASISQVKRQQTDKIAQARQSKARAPLGTQPTRPTWPVRDNKKEVTRKGTRQQEGKGGRARCEQPKIGVWRLPGCVVAAGPGVARASAGARGLYGPRLVGEREKSEGKKAWRGCSSLERGGTAWIRWVGSCGGTMSPPWRGRGSGLALG